MQEAVDAFAGDAIASLQHTTGVFQSDDLVLMGLQAQQVFPAVAEVGGHCRALRKHLGLTRAQLAQQSGVDDTLLMYFEAGAADITLAEADVLSDALGISLAGLVWRQPSQEQQQRLAVVQEWQSRSKAPLRLRHLLKGWVV